MTMPLKYFLILALAILVHAVGNEARAANVTATWTGAVSTDWNTAGNWNGGLVPFNGNGGDNFSVIIPTGLTNYPTLGTNSFTIRSITSMGNGASISGTGTLTLSFAATTTVTGTANISCPLSISVATTFSETNATDQLTISGVISGTVALTKAGSGILILAGDNSYSGLTTISAGTLKLGANGSATTGPLGTTAASTIVSNGATFDLNGFTLGTAEAISLRGTGVSAGGALTNTGGDASYSGAITLAAATTINANTSGTLTLSGNCSGNFALTLDGDGTGTYSGVRSGSGTIVKTGTSTWTLSGDNTYTGLTTISAGTLKLGANGGAVNTPLGTTTAATTVASGATLDLNGFTLGTAEAITSLAGTGVSGGGALTNTGTDASFSGNITLITPGATIAATNSGTLSLSGNIIGNFPLTLDGNGIGNFSGLRSGTGALVKQGTGTWTLSGLNTYTGTTTVTGVFLRAENNTVVASTNGPFGNNTSGLNLNGGTIQSNVVTFSRPLTVTATDSGLDAYGSARTISSAITLATAGTFNLNIGGTYAASAEGQELTLSGIISNSSGTLSLTKIGTSTAILSGTNTYTGSTTVSTGILRANTTNIIASTNGPFGNNASGLNLNGGTIQSNVATFSRPITVTATNSGIDAYGSSRTISSAIDNASGSTYNLNIGGTTAASAEGQDLTLSGVISNSSGTLGLTKIGTSKVILSGTNTFTGGVTLNSGTLNIDNNQALGTVTGTFTIAGGTIDASAAGISTLNYPLALNADFTFTGTNSLNLGAGTVSMNADRQITVSANTLTLGGTISQATRTLTKTGAGTLSFGSNTVTLNGLSISAGSLTSTSGTMNLAGNFSNNGIFTAGTGTVIYNGSSQTIAPVTYNNLTISQSGGNASLAADATVNGILNLSSGNLAVTDPYVLTMGGSATTTGAKDVTGIVKRTSLVAATSYTFGNEYTIINFRNEGTLPTEISVKISIGPAPSWKTDAVQRTYDIIRTGGSGNFMALSLHYLDTELNGNTESTLVLWDAHLPSPPGDIEEHGRSNYDLTNNWVRLSALDVSYLPTAFGSMAWSLANTAISSSTWNGLISTNWANPDNWTPSGAPSDLTDVIIPDASTTPNDPTLGLSIAVGRLTIESGGILNAAATSTLTISGASGAWSNIGGTFNASTSTVIFTNAAANISGATDFYNVTINSGGALRMAIGGTMRIGGTITNNGIWGASGVNTTVEYNGGSQTVLNPNGATPGYNNLILSGTGTKTMPGTTLSLRNAFSMSGTASATAAAAINTSGNFTIGTGTSFTAGSFTHTIGGNFSNTGTFTGTGSTINFNGAGAQTINNANTWYNLSITGTAARTVTFQSGVTQTVSNSLTLTGASGQLLSLAPSASPTKWQLNAPAAQSISYVSASYSDASNGTAISADNGTNINGGNNLNWTFSAQATPSFSPAAGAIAFGTTVTISSAGADAIYYTTDGSDPTTASTNQATTPLVINSAVTVKALAVKAGSPNSAIGSASYTQSASADLTSIILSGSPSNFTFASGTYAYNGVTVLNGVSSITVTPTGAGIITVDGTTVGSGTPSTAINLTEGVEKTIVIVATENGKSAKTYTIKVTRSLNPSKAITAFTILGNGTVDESAKTIAVTVPCNTDLTALVANFSTTGSSVTVGGVTQTSGTTANDFSSPLTYTVFAADASTQDYVVTVTVAPDPSKAITAFTILGNGTVNESAKTIAVTVPFGTDLTALVANFSTTGISVKVGLTEQTSGTTANNFSSPLTYTVTAADATTQDYVVSVSVALNPAKAITAFTILGNGTVNESGKTIAVTLPYGTDVSALVASFSTTGASVKVGGVTQSSGTTANNFSSSLTYTVTAADASTQDYVVTVTVAANPAKAITAFTILGNGTVNESGKTIAVTVPFGTDLTALVASFTTTGASVKVGGVTQTSGTTANNFSSPLTYTVTAADGSSQSYVVTVSVASNTSKALTAFTILGSGTVNESAKTIAVTVPFGTDLTALVANFSTTGASVKVGGVTQTSGTTANNFSSPLTYTVTAADASSQSYVVTVSVAPDPSKAITAFTILGNGTVNESAKTIAITVPFGTDLTALVANFSTTGTSVKVGGVTQSSGTTANNFSSPLTYTVTAADASTQDYIITVTVAANPAKAITAFTILGNGTVNESAKTIAVTLPYGTDVSALVASFSTTGASVKVGGVTQSSGTTANNFSSPLTYTVTAADASTQDYIVRVTVAANPTKAITAFTILGNGTVNESAKTIAVTVPFGTDLTALVASFTTTGASVKVGGVTQTSGTTANNFSSPLTYTVTAADASSQSYVVTVSVASNTSKALTAFTILGNGTVNESAKTIAVTVPFGTDLTALVASFTTTGASVKVGGVTQTSGTTANNFSSPLTYTVTAADASSQSYVVTVSVASNTSKALTAFTILGSGTVNESAKTIAVTVPFGTDLTALVANFTTTGTSVKVGGVTQTSGTTANNFSSPLTYTVMAADASTQDYVVTVSVTASSAKAITAFTILGNGTVNESAKTIAVTVPFGTDLTALVANFTTTGTSVKVGGVTQTSGTTANNFSSPLTYTVTAADASTQDYVVTVSVAASSAKAITAFTILGNGTVNESARTIAVTVPFGTDLTALVANFNTTGASVKVGGLTQSSGTTANNFSSPLTYTVTAADASSQDYVVTVSVADASLLLKAGSIGNNQILCDGIAAPLTETAAATGGSGIYTYQWQKSIISASTGFTDITGATNSDYTPDNLSQTTWYKRLVSSPGYNSAPLASNVITLTVVPALSHNLISAPSLTAFCQSGDPGVITGSNPTGGSGDYTYQWTSSIVGGNCNNISGATSKDYDPGIITETTNFTRVVMSGTCSYISNAITFTVTPPLISNKISGDQTIISGNKPEKLRGVVPSGGDSEKAYLWESSTLSDTSGFVPAAGINTEQNYSPDLLTQTTFFRRRVSSGICPMIYSNSVKITVNILNHPPVASDDSYTTVENTSLIILDSKGVLQNDTDPDNNPLTASVVSYPVNGSLILNSNGGFTYTPKGNFTGRDSFTYSACDNYSPDFCDTSTVTIIVTGSQLLGIAKAVSTPMRQLDGFDSNILTYKITVKNFGNVSLKNVQVADDLTKTFPFPTQFSLEGTTSTSKGILVPNTAFDGRGNSNLLKLNNTLPRGESDTIKFTIKVTPYNYIMGPYYNSARASATDPAGNLTEDISTEGTDPDPDINGIPDESNATIVMLEKVSVRIPEGFSPNGDGVNDSFIIENLDNEQINLQIFNSLGNLVYKNTNYKNEWNGVCNQGSYKGKDVPDGTYFYIISKRNNKENYVLFITIKR